MTTRGSDGSKAPDLRDVSVGRLKGAEQREVRGRTTDQIITTVARVTRAKNN